MNSASQHRFALWSKFVHGYLVEKPRQEIRNLYWSMALLDLAQSMVTIYEPVYLYTIGFSLGQILLFFLAVYLLYIFALPLGGRLTSLYGYRFSISVSLPFLIAYYFSLYNIPNSNWFMLTGVIALVIQKMFFWPGYHGNFAAHSLNRERGREVSNRLVLNGLVYVLGPLVGGLLIKHGGFVLLFTVVTFLVLLSKIPFWLHEVKNKVKPIKYSRFWKELIKPEQRQEVLSYLGYGEEFIVLILWPLYIYLMIKNVVELGSLMAVSTLVTMIVVLYIGHLTDKVNKHKLLKFSSYLYAATWFWRFLATTPWRVLFLDIGSSVSKNVLSVPMLTLIYEEAKSENVLVEIILFEMALVLGKILALVIGLLLVTFISGNPWPWLFMVAGFFSLLYSKR